MRHPEERENLPATLSYNFHMQKVIILGASDNPERYSYKVLKLLKEYGHQVYPINPKLEEIEGIKTYKDLSDITEAVDTLTIYVNPKISSELKDLILNTKTKRVIFNPDTENPNLAKELREKGIELVEACTLVMLKTGQF